MVTLKSPASAPLVVRKVFLSLSLSPSIPSSLSLLALPWNGCFLFCMLNARILEFQANLFSFRDNMVLDFYCMLGLCSSIICLSFCSNGVLG